MSMVRVLSALADRATEGSPRNAYLVPSTLPQRRDLQQVKAVQRQMRNYRPNFSKLRAHQILTSGRGHLPSRAQSPRLSSPSSVQLGPAKGPFLHRLPHRCSGKVLWQPPIPITANIPHRYGLDCMSAMWPGDFQQRGIDSGDYGPQPMLGEFHGIFDSVSHSLCCDGLWGPSRQQAKTLSRSLPLLSRLGRSVSLYRLKVCFGCTGYRAGRVFF